MTNPNQGYSYKERIPQDTRINEELPHKEKPSMLRNECQLTYYKNPKTLTNQVMHNFSQLWHSRVVKVL